jgi:glycosyltransferase involved in cell wall biosynthesis
VLAAPTYFLRELIGSHDEALAATVDPRLRIERPEMRYYAWERDVRRFSRFRATVPAVARRLYRWNLAHVFPEKYWTWALNSVRRALRMHARERFDLIVATGNPYASFAAAWLLGRLLRVPYVLDYRDSWTLDQFTDRPAFAEDHPAWRWERRVLSRAAAVTFVNEGQRRWHAERYPELADRMHVVVNGFDDELLAETPAPPRREASLRFTFLGTIIPGQPIEELAEALHLAQRDPIMAGAELSVYGYLGYFHSSVRPLLERLARAGIRYRPPVPKPEVSAVYADTDVLVFMTSGGRYVTTGKVFEYMAAGLPIVSVHAADTAAVEVLRGYPLWFGPGGLDVELIAKGMIEAAHAARDLTPERRAAARTYAETYSRARVLEPFERLLRELV